MSGIAIVVVFLALAGLMVARKLPALLAVPLMAIAMAALAGNAPVESPKRSSPTRPSSAATVRWCSR